jgi:hypothetical protein
VKYRGDDAESDVEAGASEMRWRGVAEKEIEAMRRKRKGEGRRSKEGLQGTKTLREDNIWWQKD